MALRAFVMIVGLQPAATASISSSHASASLDQIFYSMSDSHEKAPDDAGAFQAGTQ
jgi:hypothetical protein